MLICDTDQDGAEPSPNSVSCMNLQRLASFLQRPEMKQKAERILRLFTSHLTTAPVAVPELACGLAFHLRSPKQVHVVKVLCADVCNCSCCRKVFARPCKQTI